MIIFFSDLDNTLIYSYKHELGPDKICVEVYQGREISFVTARTADLLKKISEKAVIVPTTTRTVEQYERIDLGMGTFPYVLACNGGVLLTDGREDSDWYEESLCLIADSAGQMERARTLMELDAHRTMEVRYIRELFLFTKSSEPKRSAERLKEELNPSSVEVFTNGVKVYVVPRNLNKGTAARRLRRQLGAEKVFAAGDSVFDLPMLEYADYAIAPKGLGLRERVDGSFMGIGEGEVFAERMLERIWYMLQSL
ncbi:MAG: HAD hydrolase family protein [Lachnospiraceae bacterium]|nr:HAD hydrolase family protein [Lachnospiraceae bacterium]